MVGFCQVRLLLPPSPIPSFLTAQVKVLQNKPGTAMAHMDSPAGAKNAIHHLHGRKLLGETLELK